MQTFRTEFPPFPAPVSLSYQDQVFAIGSCFTEHIGQRLAERKFALHLNPFGILYNPVSIADCLLHLSLDRSFSEADLVFQSGLWHSFRHHGQFSHPEKEELLTRINQAADTSRAYLAQTNRLFITLGTAYVYRHKKLDRVVANCHKVPATAFDKYRLSVKEVVESLHPALNLLKERSPDLEVILTVSPVRHLRDGFIENQRSKAALLLAVEQLCDGHDFLHYFPAYELVLDDLRDYRFFREDLVHPNDQAVQYVWDFFQNTYFNTATRSTVQELEKLLAAAAHRPLAPNTKEHQTFVRNQLKRIGELEKQYPDLDFSPEQRRFQDQLLSA